VRRPAAGAALAVACALASPAGAATKANAARTVTDAAFVIAADDPANPRVTVIATVMRTTVTGTAAGSDTYVVCLGYRQGRVTESGCAKAAPRAVTTGVGLPDGATIRARVPVSGRRGGWIEADLALTAEGAPWVPPAVYAYWLRTAGASAAVGPAIWRDANLTGTLRTDRGLRVRPRAIHDTWIPTSVARVETYAAGADALVPFTPDRVAALL
jgi:hypothetical protein